MSNNPLDNPRLQKKAAFLIEEEYRKRLHQELRDSLARDNDTDWGSRWSELGGYLTILSVLAVVAFIIWFVVTVIKTW